MELVFGLVKQGLSVGGFRGVGIKAEGFGFPAEGFSSRNSASWVLGYHILELQEGAPQ